MKKHRWIVGIDEAGRGPLAGPVTVGVFAIPEHITGEVLKQARDSKTVTESTRNVLFEKLTNIPQSRYAVSHTSPGVIDAKGINPAVYSALSRALKKIKLEPAQCRIFLDGGLRAPEKYQDQQTIIKGDRDIPVISAASILAKVSRDKKMRTLSKRYTAYKFEQHKGYGTKLHREKIREYGLSEVHRCSFCKNVLR